LQSLIAPGASNPQIPSQELFRCAKEAAGKAIDPNLYHDRWSKNQRGGLIESIKNAPFSAANSFGIVVNPENLSSSAKGLSLGRRQTHIWLSVRMPLQFMVGATGLEPVTSCV
jgi:hypothetical protein